MTRLCPTHKANKKQPPRHHSFCASYLGSQDSSPGTPKLQGMHGKGTEMVPALSQSGISPSAEMPAGCRSSAVKPTDAAKAGFIQGQDLLLDRCPKESANLIDITHTSITGKKGQKAEQEESGEHEIEWRNCVVELPSEKAPWWS